MPLKAGTIDDFDNSMAEKMQDAFLSQWPYAMNGQEKPKMNDQMRLMFVAIAQGVVDYLCDHHSDFKVVTTDSSISNQQTGTVSEIAKA